MNERANPGPDPISMKGPSAGAGSCSAMRPYHPAYSVRSASLRSQATAMLLVAVQGADPVLVPRRPSPGHTNFSLRAAIHDMRNNSRPCFQRDMLVSP